MRLLDQESSAEQVQLPSPATVTEDGQRAARRSLRTQIAGLERQLAEAFVTAYTM
ncbi:MAG: hypothetical protein QOD66_3760, partial [Solirubrobacteraceae bacterium]|nr:hypothetical protein [Solirubrobacteraceae bacterium]